MDEMHTYSGVKKTIAGSRLLLIDMESAFSRALWAPPATRKPGAHILWEAIKTTHIKGVMSDYWSPYEKFIPTELHPQSKAETYTVEGYNSLFSHFLARLRRTSKCYSKS